VRKKSGPPGKGGAVVRALRVDAGLGAFTANTRPIRAQIFYPVQRAAEMRAVAGARSIPLLSKAGLADHPLQGAEEGK
jgi:hypothetical protein